MNVCNGSCTPEPSKRFVGLSFPDFPWNSLSTKNADKTRTKCGQNHKCEFFTYSAADTYNFNALNCPNFHCPTLHNPKSAFQNPVLRTNPDDFKMRSPQPVQQQQLTKHDHLSVRMQILYKLNTIDKKNKNNGPI
jgi:hypothetical protein